MTAVSSANDDRRLAHARSASVQTYAKLAGVLGLLSFVGGGFGEAYVPSVLVVSADATATAENIIASGSLFRLGFAAYLVEALCDVGLTWVLYVLLRPVHRDLALLTVLFRIISTAGFAMAEVLYFASSRILGGADYLKTFSPDQLNTLALLLLKVGGLGGAVFSMFYGVASVVLGYLIFRSTFLPNVLGVLMALSGLGFVTSTFVSVLAPAYATPVLFVPAAVAWLFLTVWLLVKGVDVPKWEDKAATGGAT
jgi:hypothetical protein